MEEGEDDDYDADFDDYLDAKERGDIINTIEDQELSQLQGYGILSCVFGFLIIALHCTLENDLFLSGIWFILGAIANTFGFLSTATDFFEEPKDMRILSYLFLQYDYIYSWLTVVVGYPPMVACIWVNHSLDNYARMLVILPCIPMYKWYNDDDIIFSTQVTVGLAVVSHIYLSCITFNLFGIIGALLVGFHVYALSAQANDILYGYNPRECFIIALIFTSAFLALCVGQTFWFPTQLNSTLPWNIFSAKNYIQNNHSK